MLAKTGGPSVCPSAPGSPSPPAAVTVTVHPERGHLAPGSSERLRAQVIMRTATPDKQHQANQANHHHHHHLRHLPARLLIGDWVNKLEKINANLDDEATSVAARASVAAPAGTGSNLNDAKADDDLDEGELCFKAAQLLTEFCLMLFAASLLTIAVIVIFSKKIPLFMESYEIVPKFLFFLCLFVASYSLCRWLVIKMRDFISKRSASSSPGAITKALPTPPPAPSDDGRLASATGTRKSIETVNNDCEQARVGAYSASNQLIAGQCEPLLARNTFSDRDLGEKSSDQRDKIQTPPGGRYNVLIRKCPALGQGAHSPTNSRALGRRLHEVDEEGSY